MPNGEAGKALFHGQKRPFPRHHSHVGQRGRRFGMKDQAGVHHDTDGDNFVTNTIRRSKMLRKSH